MTNVKLTQAEIEETQRDARERKRQERLNLEARAKANGETLSGQSLIDDGFRFVLRGTEFMWAHRATVRWDDIDATELNDSQFDEFHEKVYMPRIRPNAIC